MKDFRKNKVITIPNILSLFRIGLIPVIAWLYLKGENYWAVGVLILSGVTDVIDGYIARHFNMTSDVGKILDPIADKLTQAVILYCLIFKFPFMMIPFILLVIKEVFLGIIGLFAVRKTKEVKSANWHGKITTILLYSTMGLHIIWPDITGYLSNLTIGACLVFMILSFVLYSLRHIRQLRGAK